MIGSSVLISSQPPVLMLASGPHGTVVEAFRRGMRDLGYVEAQCQNRAS